jgi:hypothetical protein
MRPQLNRGYWVIQIIQNLKQLQPPASLDGSGVLQWQKAFSSASLKCTLLNIRLW